jgi:hypothetical protein
MHSRKAQFMLDPPLIHQLLQLYGTELAVPKSSD